MIKNNHLYSKCALSILTILAIMQLTCIQGPWSYTADDEKIFRGITVNAYMISGRPISSICFERLYALEEKSTPAFAFYDSAYVEISGDGGNGEDTVTLTPHQNSPSCFTGPDNFIGIAGETYRLRAIFFWDSAGSRVKSTITGTTTIPEQFSISDTARANASVFSSTTGSIPESAGSLQRFLEGLPQDVSSQIIQLYLPEISPLASDSAALLEYFVKNRQRIANSIDSLLGGVNQLLPFNENDTINYLGGVLNLASHYFKARYSDDVKGVLLTQRFDEDAENPSTRFDNIAATFRELTPADFYFRGTVRRLQFFSRLEGTGTDFRLFDAIPVNNAYLKGGKNVLYFYATDIHYAKFVPTYIENHSSSKIKPVHSVQGAQGFFAGLSVDSFVVHIRIPQQLASYRTFEARADFCRNEDWDNADCRSFEPDYCSQVLFNEMQYAYDHPDRIKKPVSRNDCLAEAVAFYLERGKPLSYLEDSVLQNRNRLQWQVRTESGATELRSKTFSSEQLTEARTEGLLSYCMQSEFSGDICSNLEDYLRKASPVDPQLQKLFTYCIDNQWRSSSCGWALVKYVNENSDAAAALKEAARAWCTENSTDPVCK